ncbi:MAG: protease inhibitor I9 family protein [Nanoarchaeota archaeon]
MAIDEILGNVGEYTKGIVDNLQPGQKHKFLIVPTMPNYQKPNVDPANFPDKSQYRDFLVSKHAEFFDTNTADVRNLMDSQGVEYLCMKHVSMFAADLTKEQYEILTNSQYVKSITADQPLQLFDP